MLVQHRADPSCATCHNLMDPIGFGLENFDWMGRWRDTESNGQPVDASGTLPSGEKFNGPVELRQVLLNRKDDFLRHLTGKGARLCAGPQPAGWRPVHRAAAGRHAGEGRLPRAHADPRDRAERAVPQYAGRRGRRRDLPSPRLPRGNCSACWGRNEFNPALASGWTASAVSSRTGMP